MPFDIATGTYSEAPSVLPFHAALSPAVAGVTQTTPVASGPPTSGPLVGGVRDLTGERLGQLAAAEADCRGAQSTAMSARDAMLGHYEGQVMPLGGQAGDNLMLPVVPDSATVPASSDQYPWPGDEPVPSSAGPGYQGNVPQ